MQSLNIKVVDGPEAAPNYVKEGGWQGLTLHTCIVVRRGTEGGKPTVDLQLVDEAGNRYVAMITGALLNQASAVVVGASGQSEPNN